MKKIKLKHSTGNRLDEYHYLIFYRPNEKITRIDKYSIMMYWDEYNNGNYTIRNELLFYPSRYAMGEIEESKNISAKEKQLINRLDQLKKYGNPWWNFNTNEKLNLYNWILNEEEKTKVKPKNKRLQLKCR